MTKPIPHGTCPGCFSQIYYEAAEQGCCCDCEDRTTRIWSGEHKAYWRPNAEGYTVVTDEAGTWAMLEAIQRTKHCGPEKKIELRTAPPKFPASPQPVCRHCGSVLR